MIILGLTGSIGMGKTETARMFRECGLPVYDADGAVHEIYSAGGAAVAPLGEAFPGVVVEGAVDRQKLSKLVLGEGDVGARALARLEAIAHPLVLEMQAQFLETARAGGHGLVVLDIPLLLETGADSACDYVAVVSAPEKIQRQRVLARPGMSEERLEAILFRQMPDPEKRDRADFVIETGESLEAAEARVREIVEQLRARAAQAEKAE